MYWEGWDTARLVTYLTHGRHKNFTLQWDTNRLNSLLNRRSGTCCHPSTQEAKARVLLQIQGQAGLHREF